MTNKQLIKTLRNIKKYCDEQEACALCKFYFPNNENDEYWSDCQLLEVVEKLDFIPSNWKIDEVERIINEQTDN